RRRQTHPIRRAALQQPAGRRALEPEPVRDAGPRPSLVTVAAGVAPPDLIAYPSRTAREKTRAHDPEQSHGAAPMCANFSAAPAFAGALAGAAGTAYAGKDLDAIKARGQLQCGVTTGGISGFMSVDSQGKWVGLDVDICRAVSSAIFGEPDKVKYVP